MNGKERLWTAELCDAFLSVTGSGSQDSPQDGQEIAWPGEVGEGGCHGRFCAVSCVRQSCPPWRSSSGEFQGGIYIAPGQIFTVKSPLGPEPVGDRQLRPLRRRRHLRGRGGRALWRHLHAELRRACRRSKRCGDGSRDPAQLAARRDLSALLRAPASGRRDRAGRRGDVRGPAGVDRRHAPAAWLVAVPERPGDGPAGARGFVPRAGRLHAATTTPT